MKSCCNLVQMASPDIASLIGIAMTALNKAVIAREVKCNETSQSNLFAYTQN